MPTRQPFKRQLHNSPGSHLKQRLFGRLGFALMMSSFGFGLLVPHLPWINSIWTINVSITLAYGVILVCIIIFFWPGKWSLKNIEKGLDSEQHVGERIEYALTNEGCAVAHSVLKIAQVGDIDHLVATPRRIWVVETKYRRVPKKQFPKVLHRLAVNTKAVRKWAPARTPVQACLVLAREAQTGKNRYTTDNEEIVVHTSGSLVKVLKSEARAEKVLPEEVSWNIWRLGH